MILVFHDSGNMLRPGYKPNVAVSPNLPCLCANISLPREQGTRINSTQQAAGSESQVKPKKRKGSSRPHFSSHLHSRHIVRLPWFINHSRFLDMISSLLSFLSRILSMSSAQLPVSDGTTPYQFCWWSSWKSSMWLFSSTRFLFMALDLS